MAHIPQVLIADVWQLIIPLAFMAAVSVIGSLIRSLQESTRRPLRPGAEPTRQQPKQDLETFLKELGMAEPTPPPPAPVRRRPASGRPPAPKQGRRAEPAKAPDSEHARRRTVQGHHLESTLKSRHAASLHSELEGRHLGTHVGLEPLVAEEFRTHDAPGPSTSPSETVLGSMLADKDQFTRAFILGQILAPPPGLRDL